MAESLDVSATRALYDAVAVSYEELLRDFMAEKVYDRAMLAAFTARVRDTGTLESLAAGGSLLLAFQTGTPTRHIERAYGHDVSMDAHLMARTR